MVLASRADAAAGLAGLAAALVLGACAAWRVLRSPQCDDTPLAAIVCAALLLRGLALLGQPLLEDDHFRYLWDGYRFATGGTPYGLAPAAFFGDAAVAPPFDSILNSINYPEIPTIYGPVLQLLFVAGYAISPGQVWPLQLINAGVDIVLLLLLAGAGGGRRWLLLYALSPLVLKEAVLTAHPDGLAGLLAVAALVVVRRRWLGAGLLGLAIASKVAAVVLLPFLWRRGRWRALALAVAVVAACYLPFVLQTGSDLTALSTFSRNWRFNPLLFSIIEGAAGRQWARELAALALAAVLLAIYWRDLARAEFAARGPAADQALGALLALAPVVNPWYALWWLPFAVLRPSRTAWAATFVLPLSYWNSSNLAGHGVGQFDVAIEVTAAQLTVLAACAWRDWRQPLPANAFIH